MLCTNRLTLIGFLGHHKETGEYDIRTEWHRVISWNKPSQWAADLQKGAYEAGLSFGLGDPIMNVLVSRHTVRTPTHDRSRVLSERNTIGRVFATAVADIPVRYESSLYSRFGNLVRSGMRCPSYRLPFSVARPRPGLVRF